MSEAARAKTGPEAFPQTRWSVVLAARQDCAAALENICSAYWYPLYAYVRRSGHDAHDAQDITQEFFCRLLEKRWLDSVERDRGKLRTFLVVALKRFMLNEWRRGAAMRRGGGQVHVPIDTVFAETRYASDQAVADAPEAAFDRQWALTLLDLTFKRLLQEYEASGKRHDFEQMKNSLMAERGAIDYSGIAQALNMSEGAARVAIHRLRKRFREIYREEIVHTLEDGADIDEELRHLAKALC